MISGAADHSSRRPGGWLYPPHVVEEGEWHRRGKGRVDAGKRVNVNIPPRDQIAPGFPPGGDVGKLIEAT